MGRTGTRIAAILAIPLWIAAVPAGAQDEPEESYEEFSARMRIANDLAERAEALFRAGDEDAARALVRETAPRLGDMAADAASPFTVPLAGASLDGDLSPGLEYARFAFEAMRGTALEKTPSFIEVAEYRARFCATVGDVDCIEETAQAALDAGSGPSGDYTSGMREVTEWRIIAHYARGERDKGRALLTVLTSEFGEPTIERMASDLSSLAFGGEKALPLKLALRQEAVRLIETAPERAEHGIDRSIHYDLGVEYQNAGMLAEAEKAYRSAWQISDREFDEDSIGAIMDSSALADILAMLGRWDEAMPLYERNWAIAEKYGDWSLDVQDQLGDWALALVRNGRMAEADALTERVVREARVTEGVSGDTMSQYLNVRAVVLRYMGRDAEAEPLFREAMETNSQGDLGGGATIIANLAAVIEGQGRYAEAEPLRRRAYEEIRSNIIFSPFSSGRVAFGIDLATNLSKQGKREEADALFDEFVAFARKLPDPSGRVLGEAAAAQARHLLDGGRTEAALPLAKIALEASTSRLDLLGPGSSEAEYLAAASGQRTAALLVIEAVLSGAAGEQAAMPALFEASQRAGTSAAASALALNAAETLAAREGAGAAVSAWRAAQSELTLLDAQIAALSSSGEAADVQRRAVLDRRAAAQDALQSREAALAQGFPRFFDLARPRPASLADTQTLLGAEEALVLLVPGSGEFGGMVMAVTRERSAAAQIGIAPEALGQLVAMLHSGLADPGSGYTAHPDFDLPEVIYSRERAHDLYNALFADAQIAALLSGKARWTLVPQRELASVAYAALVSAPPPGGAAGDSDPEALRATEWLGIERALAIAPSVSSLALARGEAAGGAAPARPFFGFGDPAFDGAPDPPVEMPEDLRERGLLAAVRVPAATRGYYRGDVADLSALGGLDRLPGTAIEVAVLAEVLGAGPDSVMMQMDATEARVYETSESGQLGDSALVIFATHGLIAGEGFAEPALALTPPPGVAQEALTASNDGLLTASEAAWLRLAADWLILSACNTSAGAGANGIAGGEGLSGLARGFLYAGARALLVSHFPVSDRATPLLTAAAVSARRDESLDRAAALREARVRMLADPRDDDAGVSLAHPKAWAALALVSPAP